MNAFHDTNSIIAYCFINDRWNRKAEIIFRSYLHHYTSDKVVEEFKSKEEEIIKKFHSKISEFSEKIRGSNEDIFYPDDKLKLIKNADNRIRNFIYEILEKHVEFPISRDDLADFFMELYLNFINVEKERFNKLTKIVKIHKRHSNYPELEEKLKAIGIHNGGRDRGILLDAHDLAVKLSIPVCFVTSDDCICEKNKQKILRILRLSDIVDLRYII